MSHLPIKRFMLLSCVAVSANCYTGPGDNQIFDTLSPESGTGSVDSGADTRPGPMTSGAGDAGGTGDGGGVDGDGASRGDDESMGDTTPVGDEGTGGGNESGSTGSDEPVGDSAVGIRISDIEANQGVSFPVVVDGSLIEENNRAVPMVKNRHMLIRVYWELDNDFTDREIEAVLTLDHGNGEIEELKETKFIDGPPDADSLSGTFSFVLEPGQVTPDMAFSVGFFEAGGAQVAGPGEPAYPPEGTVALGVPDTQMKIGLTIVPYRVGNSSPNLSDSALEEFRAFYYAFQPIEFGEDGLKITVHPNEQSAPYSDSQIVLDAVCALRDNDLSSGFADGSEYYHSAVASQVTSGVLGVAYVLPNANGGPRCGSNLWDSSLQQGPHTMAHEIGHNQGRPHAPCGGVANPDPGFPHNGGKIGTHGWNPISGQLISPQSTDYMGYCNNTWISDYNYRLNAIRNAQLQVSSLVDGDAPPVTVLTGHQLESGEVTWSVHRKRGGLESGLVSAGQARVSTSEGVNVDVTLYRRELSEGHAVVGVVEGVTNGIDIASVRSNVFGSPQEVQPTVY